MLDWKDKDIKMSLNRGNLRTKELGLGVRAFFSIFFFLCLMVV